MLMLSCMTALIRADIMTRHHREHQNGCTLAFTAPPANIPDCTKNHRTDAKLGLRRESRQTPKTLGAVLDPWIYKRERNTFSALHQTKLAPHSTRRTLEK